MIRVLWTRTEDDWKAVLALRIAVFVVEQGCPLEEEPDAFDDMARHLMAVEDGQVVGCARIIAKGEAVAKIGRVAVRNDRRGTGVGTDLMRFALDALAAEGIVRVLLESQAQVIPFYERLGFVASGPMYPDAGIPHRHMELEMESMDDARGD